MTRILTASLLVAAAGCSSSDTGPAPPQPIPIESFRAEFMSATCDFETRCTLMPDTATCQKLEAPDYAFLQLTADVALGTVAYDPGAARTWVELLRAQPCAVHDTASKRALDDAWKAVFKGKAAAMASCFVDGECQPNLVCDTSMCMSGMTCCAGKCASAPQPIALGAPCGMDTTPCVDGAFCGPDMTNPMMSVCQPVVSNGQPCPSTDACQDNAYCDTSGSSQCYVLSPDGGMCTATLAIACQNYSSYCDPKSNVCVALPRDGQPCTPAGQCALYAFCNNGSCKTRPQDGEMCADGGPPCLGASDCSNGVCTKRDTQVCTGG